MKIYGRAGLPLPMPVPVPVLWLFTDAARLPDPRAAVARLPRGLCGVVLRHDDAPDRAALGRDLARICHQRRNRLVVAGDWRLAARLHAGLHLRRGFRSGGKDAQPVTSSAHTIIECRRAARAGARLAFLSPAFATASHMGAPGLGGARWATLAGKAGLAVGALGGIDGRSVRRLPPRLVAAVGAIGALA